jgi:plastocyanin
MSTKNLWIGVVAVIVVIAALFAYLHASKSAPETPATQSGTTTPSAGNAAVGANGQSVVINYTDSGFSPKNVSVSEGTTVTWANNSSGMMWIASNNHPTHTGYDGTSQSQHCVSGAPESAQVFDECTAVPQGGSFSFTFGKAGTWGFHNHMHESDQGSVTVTAANSLGASAAAAPKLNPDAYPD